MFCTLGRQRRNEEKKWAEKHTERKNFASSLLISNSWNPEEARSQADTFSAFH